MLDEIGHAIQPDLVLLFFCHCNDLANNNYRLDLPHGDLSVALKPYFDMPEYEDTLTFIGAPPPSRSTDVRQTLREYSMLYNTIETGVILKLELGNPREQVNAIGGLSDDAIGKYDVQPRNEWLRGWRITDALLARMKERSESLGARLVVVSIPEWRALDRTYWDRDTQKRNVASGRVRSDAPVRRLEAATRSLGVAHIDLTDAMQARGDEAGLFSVFIPEDLHWTPDGHRVAADAIETALRAQDIVP